MQPSTATITAARHFIQSFSWMLLHSLWQGLIVALLAGALLATFGKATAAKRYNLLLANLLLLVASCIATFYWEWVHVPTVAASAGSASSGVSALTRSGMALVKQFAESCLAYFSANAPTIVMIWFIFFLFRAVRMMGGLLYVHRARRRLVFQPDAYWAERVATFAQRLGINKAVKLLESGFVKAPVVIGNLKPVILIPVGLLSGLPAGQIEAILLHELAHIRRHDYFVNLLQNITETVFFFNPGLLWILSLLREERENCCDDIALAETRNKKEFVQALISFKEYSLSGMQYKVAFPGTKNQLLNRASRILSNKNRGFGTPEKASFTAGLIILLAVLTAAAATTTESVRNQIINTVKNVVVHSVGRQAAKPALVPQVTVRVAHAVQHHTRIVKTDSLPASPNDSMKFASDSALPTFAGPTADARATDNGDRVSISDPAGQKEQAQRDQEQAARDKLQAMREQAQALTDRQQGAKDQEQAKKDRDDALRDRAAAIRDKEQAMRDQQPAMQLTKPQQENNDVQAKKNEEQSMRDRIQAQKNEEQVTKNEEQVRLNQLQDEKNKEQAARNDMQAKLNADQAARNEQQAKLNKLQEEKNKMQEQKNEEQAKLNEIQAKKNNEQQGNHTSVQE